MKVSFDTLVPVERTLILVASDEKYSALVDDIHSRKILNLLPSFLMPYYFLVNVVPFGPKEIKKILNKGDLPIPHLSPREAWTRFQFDHGHPQDGAVYISHPVLDNHYLIPALANERLAQEKVAAFMDLTAALGAKEMYLVNAEILDRKKAAKFDIATEAAKVGIEYTRINNADVERKLFRQFQKPSKPPYVPENIKKWLEEDPKMRSVANARINAKVVKDQALIKIENRIDIASSVTVGFEKRSIGAGGEMKNVISQVFSFSIEYWPVGDE